MSKTIIIEGDKKSQQIIQNEREKKSRLYFKQPFNLAYTDIINKTAHFIKDELKYDDSINISIIFEYLLWNGYFSNNKEYMFSQSKRINNKINYGADIMLGRGTCLNNSVMLSDLLNSLNNNNFTISCFVDYQEEKIPKTLNINREINSHESLKSKIINNLLDLPKIKKLYRRLGNHVVVVCKYKNEYILVDPTNLVFLNFKSYDEAIVLNSNIIYDLSPSIFFDNNSVCDIPLENMVKYKKEPYLREDEILKMSEEIKNFCNNNISLFDDLYDSYHDSIDIVCKTLTKKISR